mgnify:CR=1 FL=1
MTRTNPAATRTVAYLRVSTSQQADTGVSLDAQRAKVEAALYDLELVAVIVDAGASAKTLDRDGLSEALGMLRAGTADALLVAKLDRLTRSVRDLDTLISNHFGDRCALLSVSEQIDTRSAAGRLVLNVLASVSQWEREAIGERTSVALQHKRSRGEYTGGRAPYGWSVSAHGCTLEANPAEQRILAIAKPLRESGMSLRKVGESLAAEGLLPRSGGCWHAKTVRDLLKARAA